MIWGPFLLALALGLLVSAGLYFAYLWPQVEPEDPVPAPAPEEKAKPEPAENTASDTGDAKVEPAPDKPADEEPQEPPPSAA